MGNNQSVSKRIINVLREINATTEDLSKELDMGESTIRTTIYRMVKSGVVIHTGRFVDRYKLYRLARPEESYYLPELRKQLLLLRKYMNYKNSGYCKGFLEKIINKYFNKSSGAREKNVLPM